MQTKGVLPLIIGVTGHRDLRDEDRAELESCVRGIFGQLRQLYPATPLLLLSSLAEGADRLVAQVALDCGARLIAPLPLPRKEYEKDFETTVSKAEFAELLARAETYFTVPPIDEDTLSDVQGDARAQRYFLAGAYIAQHSIILLALWDGVNSKLIGGTSHIVRIVREGASAIDDLKDVSPKLEAAAVYHIVTPRVSNPKPQEPSFAVHRYFSRGWNTDHQAQAAHYCILQSIDCFNRRAGVRTPKLGDGITAVSRTSQEHANVRSATMERLFKHYVSRAFSLSVPKNAPAPAGH